MHENICIVSLISAGNTCEICCSYGFLIILFGRSNFEKFSHELHERPTLLRQHAVAISATICSAMLVSSFFVAGVPHLHQSSLVAPSTSAGLKLLVVGFLFQRWPTRSWRNREKTDAVAKDATSRTANPSVHNDSPSVKAAPTEADFSPRRNAATSDWNDFSMASWTITDGF